MLTVLKNPGHTEKKKLLVRKTKTINRIKEKLQDLACNPSNGQLHI